MTMHGIMHLILNRLKELLRHLHPWVIVDAEGINLQNLAIEHLFRRTDVTDASQQFIEVVSAASPLQQVVVQCKSFHDILFQHLCCPHAELNTPIGMHPIAHADNHVKVVEINHVALRLPLDGTMLSGSCKFCNHHILVQLPLLKHILNVP